MSEGDLLGEADSLSGVPLPEHRAKLVGHEAQWRTFQSLLDGARLPGAMLLHGPRGIGKATFAFKAAEAIFLHTGDEDSQRVSSQMLAGSHPNLFLLRRQPKEPKGFYSVIRVDEIRALRERLRRTRGRPGHRVVVIDAIDDCNPNAANALLKILEEPPSETLFLLVSHRPGGLLPTIRSRCQQLPFRPVGNADVQRVLAETALDLSGPELATAVALAEGRPRRAFEAMAVSGAGFLSDLQTWLRDPLSAGHAAHLSIAESLGPGASDAAWLFARDMLVQWCANAAREAALTGDRARLASANALWDKAQAIFAETESLNLDARQSLTILLDTILVHLRLGASAPETA